MTGVSMFNIGGLASGLDTNGILAQLLQVERIPITQLQTRQSALKKVDESWAGINTKLSSFRSAIDGLKDRSKWDAFVNHSSSNTDVLTVSSTGAATPGAVQLTVEQLAFAGQRASGDEFDSTDDAIGARTLTITVGADSWVIDPEDDAKLSDFVTAINNSGAPVRAQAVKVDTKYQLVITANETGTANDFSLTPSGWTNPFSTLQAAQNAVVTVGDPVTGLEVERSTNTITDLIDGVRIQLKSTSASPVTVTTSRDDADAVGAVKKLVDAANGLITALKDASAYDAETQKAAPLNGDPTVRRLIGDVQRKMSDLISGVTGDYATPGSLGIELTRDGAITFDESVFRQALEDDFAAVRSAFLRSGSTDDARLAYVRSTDKTQTGTYEIAVTQVATKAAVTGSAYVAADETFTITSGTRVATVTATSGMTLAQLVAEINTQLDAEGITTVNAEESGGAIRLFESNYGSPAAFTVTSSESPATTVFGLAGTQAGLDVQVTVDGGTPITGTGQLVTVDEGDAEGLSLRVQAAGLGVIGNVTVAQGLGGSLSSLISGYEGAAGLVQGARNEAKSTIDDFQKRIEALEIRIRQREITLRRQFSSMESAMNQLAQQGNRLAAALQSLGGGR